MQFAPLAPQFGVEVKDIDFRRPLDDNEVRELRAALDQHKLLLVRGQQLSDEDHLRFALSFGFSAVLGPNDGPRTISNRRVGGDEAIKFHCDHIYTEGGASPGLTLYGLELPVGGTSTTFADTTLALTTLPETTRRRIASLEAWSAYVLPKFRPVRRNPGLEVDAGFRSLHPVVFTHPRTGTKLLLISDDHTERIDGLPQDESCQLLEELCQHIAKPAHCYEHHWQLDDLVVWDNIVLQHARGENKLEQGPRTLRRLALDDRPLETLTPQQALTRSA